MWLSECPNDSNGMSKASECLLASFKDLNLCPVPAKICVRQIQEIYVS